IVRQPACAVRDCAALFQYQNFESGIDAPRARRRAQARGDSSDHQQPHQPYFCALTNSRISNCLISRSGKKLFTASCSSLNISKIVVSLVATRSSTLRLFRFKSLTIPPFLRNAVELTTTAPKPVL